MASSSINPEVQQQFMYLFERVTEPLYFGPKGNEGNLVTFNVPEDMCPETVHAATSRKQAFSGLQMKQIGVEKPTQMPDLSGIAAACPRSSIYNYFNPNHRRAVQELKQIMVQQRDLKSLLNMACACRDSPIINPRVWVNALASSLITRPDTRGFRMPAIWEILPDLFFAPYCLKQALRQSAIPQQDRARIVLQENFAGRDANPENRMNYFREDLGINSHHWHWHLIYTLVDRRDRRGELFYFMHHEMIARYEAERFANSLSQVRPLMLDDPLVKEGYFPKLTDTNSGLIWGGRQQESKLRDVNRLDDAGLPQSLRVVTMENMKKYRNRVLEAIDSGTVLMGNGRVPLNIDMLGDMVEASAFNPNPQYYGDLHNMGHVVLAAIHDPEFKHRENLGVMSDTSTAMRDPVFYRWHKYIDQLFDRYKQTLPPYNPTGGDFPLAWSGIQVESIQVQTNRQGVQPNTFTTFRMRSNVDLARGLDFMRVRDNLGPVLVSATHLNHDPYTFTITVRNNTNGNRTGTVRIFMAPRLNVNGDRLPIAQQRLLFFHLDKFTVQLNPGANTITRRSSESTVSVPWEQTFRELERNVETPAGNAQTFCGCGWPQHMLIPRGTAAGQLYDIVAFITNGDEDRVEQTTPTAPRTTTCRDSLAYCGVLDQLYPDRKPMGYPFDRNPYNATGSQVPVSTLEAYISGISNMRAVQTRVIYDSARIEINNDGTPTGMREINGDPNMPTTQVVCQPGARQGGAARPESPSGPSTSSMGQLQGSSSSASPTIISRPSSRPNVQRPPNWTRQYHQHRGTSTSQSSSQGSRSPSPTGWTRVSSSTPTRKLSNWGNWGWGG